MPSEQTTPSERMVQAQESLLTALRKAYPIKRAANE